MLSYSELVDRNRTLEADLQRERAEHERCRSRIELLEASNRRAFALAAWGGANRDRRTETERSR